MKYTILAIAVSMSTLLATPVFAGDEDMAGKSAEARSPANVEVLALQEKLAYCINNVKSEGLKCNTYVECSERKRHVASCMNLDDAQVQYALRTAPTHTDTAATDYNKMLQQTPTTAGNK